MDLLKKYKWWIISGAVLIMLTFPGYYFRVELGYVANMIYYTLFDNSDAVGKERIAAFGIGLPKKFEIHGIDISRYQSKIEWNKLGKAEDNGVKISFIFIKATEGADNYDRHFNYNWRQAKRYGLIRGAYHFYNPNVNSKLQAKNFIQTVKLEKGDLPPVLDIEITGRYSVDNTRLGIKNWLRIIEEHYHVKPVIYTSLGFYLKHIQNEGFSDYPFWIAHYYKPKLYLSSNLWTFWQHSDKGKVPGIRGNVDFNVFNGSSEELQKLLVP